MTSAQPRHPTTCPHLALILICIVETTQPSLFHDIIMLEPSMSVKTDPRLRQISRAPSAGSVGSTSPSVPAEASAGDLRGAVGLQGATAALAKTGTGGSLAATDDGVRFLPNSLQPSGAHPRRGPLSAASAVDGAASYPALPAPAGSAAAPLAPHRPPPTPNAANGRDGGHTEDGAGGPAGPAVAALGFRDLGRPRRAEGGRGGHGGCV